MRDELARYIQIRIENTPKPGSILSFKELLCNIDKRRCQVILDRNHNNLTALELKYIH